MAARAAPWGFPVLLLLLGAAGLIEGGSVMAGAYSGYQRAAAACAGGNVSTPCAPILPLESEPLFQAGLLTATIGALLLIAGGAWLLKAVRNRSPRDSPPAP